jgi:hypothetical protein
MDVVEKYRDLLIESVVVFAILLVIAMVILAATMLLCALVETKRLEKRREWLARLLLSTTLPQLWSQLGLRPPAPLSSR